MQTLFWLAVFGSLFSYFIYPFTLVWLRSRFQRSETSGAATNGESPTTVSIIVTAHNEATQIKEKIENTLALDTTGFEVQMIVASDLRYHQTSILLNLAKQPLQQLL